MSLSSVHLGKSYLISSLFRSLEPLQIVRTFCHAMSTIAMWFTLEERLGR